MLAALMVGGMGIVELLKWVIIIAAVVAVVVIALKAMGIVPPQWLVQMLIVVAIAFAAIFCIVLLASM